MPTAWPITTVDEPFAAYQARCSHLLEDFLSRAAPGSLDEQAFPAYIEGNPLSRRVFWKRIAFCYRYVDRFRNSRDPPARACLDFGCGSGLMLPRLSEFFATVHAVDLERNPSRFLLRSWNWAGGVRHDLSGVSLSDSLEGARIRPGSLALITALDVLEHVDDLGQLLGAFENLLRPGGVLLVSGPTESILYRIGRWITGFSGHYHVRDIYDIQQELEHTFRVTVLKRLPPVTPLFHILEATKS